MKLRLLLLGTLLFVSAICQGIDERFLHMMAHIKTSPAFAISANHQQVITNDTNQIRIFSTFNVWQPRLEAAFYSIFPIEDINIAGDKYIFICSSEATNSVSTVDSVQTYGKIYFTNTVTGEKLTREGSTLYIADRYRGIDIVDIGGGGSKDLRSTFSEKWGIRDFYAEYPYLYALNDFGLVTVDIGDQQFPVSLGTNYELNEARVIAKNGETLWIGSGKSLVAINIRNVKEPKMINQYRLASQILDIEIKDNRLYAALGSGGVKIIDVANPLRIEDLSTINVPFTVYDLALDADYIYLGLGRDGWMIYQYR